MVRISCFVLIFCLFFPSVYPAPAYGTRLPQKEQFQFGFETYVIFERSLEAEFGELRSNMRFLKITCGIYDWLSLDLKGGSGNLKQHPLNSDEIDYPSSFAGGYGLRFKFYDQKKIKGVLGFQHISVHPRSVRLEGLKNMAILDDWQVSLLGSYDFSKFTPYLGAKWSRVDYIHWLEGNRKRRMSDLTESLGIIVGADIGLSPNTWLNLEGQFFDGEALAASFNFSF